MKHTGGAKGSRYPIPHISHTFCCNHGTVCVIIVKDLHITLDVHIAVSIWIRSPYIPSADGFDVSIRHYSKVSRHDSRTKHPEKMKIDTGDDSVVEGRPRLRPGLMVEATTGRRLLATPGLRLRRVRIPGSDSATQKHGPP